MTEITNLHRAARTAYSRSIAAGHEVQIARANGENDAAALAQLAIETRASDAAWKAAQDRVRTATRGELRDTAPHILKDLRT